MSQWSLPANVRSGIDLEVILSILNRERGAEFRASFCVGNIFGFDVERYIWYERRYSAKIISGEFQYIWFYILELKIV
jgi:hypothetical protein